MSRKPTKSSPTPKRERYTISTASSSFSAVEPPHHQAAVEERVDFLTVASVDPEATPTLQEEEEEGEAADQASDSLPRPAQEETSGLCQVTQIISSPTLRRWVGSMGRTLISSLVGVRWAAVAGHSIGAGRLGVLLAVGAGRLGEMAVLGAGRLGELAVLGAVGRMGL